MFFPLFFILGTLNYGGCGNWSVQYDQRSYEATSSCISFQCRYTYPTGHQVKAEIWTAAIEGGLYGDEREVIAYHTNEDQIHPYFKGRTTFLGHMNGDCTLHINDLEIGDGGEYRFNLDTNRNLFSADHNIILVMDRRSIIRQRDHCKLRIASPEVLVEGKEAVLTCYGVTCRGGIYPQWYNNSDERLTGRTSTKDSYNIASLSIMPSWQDNRKVIQCGAYYRGYRFTDMCMISSKLTLDVRHIPKGVQTVLLSSSNEGSNEEDTVELKCIVVASNPAVSNYIWYKDGSQIPNQYLQIIRIKKIMTITELQRFTCVAQNEIGPSPRSHSNLVSVTERFNSTEGSESTVEIQMTSRSCSSFLSGLLIGISVPTVAAMTIAVAVSTWCCLKKKKKKKSNGAAATSLPPRSSQHETGNLVYTNVENTYAALDKTQISPDYEEVKRENRPA